MSFLRSWLGQAAVIPSLDYGCAKAPVEAWGGGYIIPVETGPFNGLLLHTSLPLLIPSQSLFLCQIKNIKTGKCANILGFLGVLGFKGAKTIIKVVQSVKENLRMLFAYFSFYSSNLTRIEP